MAQICSESGCPHPKPCPIHKPRRSPSSKKTSSPGWRKVRQKVLERDEFTCWMCGGAANTVDHVRPAATAGTNDENNLRAACAECNRSKGAN